jgi:hypothetical protein
MNNNVDSIAGWKKSLWVFLSQMRIFMKVKLSKSKNAQANNPGEYGSIARQWLLELAISVSNDRVRKL